MKHLIAAALMLVGSAAHADEWNTADKAKHFRVGAAIAGATMLVSNPEVGFLVGTAAGLAKEVYDYRSRARGGEHDPSYKDFGATALGAAAGAYLPGLVIGRRSVTYTWNFK